MHHNMSDGAKSGWAVGGTGRALGGRASVGEGMPGSVGEGMRRRSRSRSRLVSPWPAGGNSQKSGLLLFLNL